MPIILCFPSLHGKYVSYIAVNLKRLLLGLILSGLSLNTIAATVTFSFDGGVDGRSYTPGSIVSQALFDSLYSFDTLASVEVSIEYDGTLDSLSLSAFELTIGSDTYSMDSPENQSILVTNDESIFLGTYDRFYITTPEVSGAFPLGMTPRSIWLWVEDGTADLFENDVPTLLEIVSIASYADHVPTITISFEDVDGTYVGDYRVSPEGNLVSVDVEDARIPEVPLPASFYLFMASLASLGISKRSK